MELDPEIYLKLCAIDWFKMCGLEPPGDLRFDFQRAPNIAAAIAGARSSDWQNAGTAAQGELTRYLARTDYDVYGTNWSRLARASRERMKAEVVPRVTEALVKISAEPLSDVVLLDLNRIAVRSAFVKRFKRAPDFYERLLVVYERGHLPCGWLGDLDSWPEGKLILY